MLQNEQEEHKKCVVESKKTTAELDQTVTTQGQKMEEYQIKIRDLSNKLQDGVAEDDPERRVDQDNQGKGC